MIDIKICHEISGFVFFDSSDKWCNGVSAALCVLI